MKTSKKLAEQIKMQTTAFAPITKLNPYQFVNMFLEKGDNIRFVLPVSIKEQWFCSIYPEGIVDVQVTPLCRGGDGLLAEAYLYKNAEDMEALRYIAHGYANGIYAAVTETVSKAKEMALDARGFFIYGLDDVQIDFAQLEDSTPVTELPPDIVDDCYSATTSEISAEAFVKDSELEVHRQIDLEPVIEDDTDCIMPEPSCDFEAFKKFGLEPDTEEKQEYTRPEQPQCRISYMDYEIVGERGRHVIYKDGLPFMENGNIVVFGKQSAAKQFIRCLTFGGDEPSDDICNCMNQPAEPEETENCSTVDDGCDTAKPASEGEGYTPRSDDTEGCRVDGTASEEQTEPSCDLLDVADADETPSETPADFDITEDDAVACAKAVKFPAGFGAVGGMTFGEAFNSEAGRNMISWLASGRYMGENKELITAAKSLLPLLQ